MLSHLPDRASYRDNMIFKSFWNDNITEVSDLWSFIIVMLHLCVCLVFPRSKRNIISRRWTMGLNLSSCYTSDKYFQEHYAGLTQQHVHYPMSNAILRVCRASMIRNGKSKCNLC